MCVEYVFELVCDSVIPQCGYRCEVCMREIQEVLGKIKGVRNISEEGEGDATRLVIECDETVLTESLAETFTGLPTMYDGHFVPLLIEKR